MVKLAGSGAGVGAGGYSWSPSFLQIRTYLVAVLRSGGQRGHFIFGGTDTTDSEITRTAVKTLAG